MSRGPEEAACGRAACGRTAHNTGFEDGIETFAAGIAHEVGPVSEPAVWRLQPAQGDRASLFSLTFPAPSFSP